MPNTILATFTKSPILLWQHFIKNPPNYWANNYSIKSQILFGKSNILCSKPKINLWQQHILIY